MTRGALRVFHRTTRSRGKPSARFVFPTLTRSAGRFSTRTTRSKAVAGVNLRSDPDVWAGASGRTEASAGRLPTLAVPKSVSICRTHDRAHGYGGWRTYFSTRHGARFCRLYARFVSTFHTQLQIIECPSQSKFQVLSEQYRPGRASGT